MKPVPKGHHVIVRVAVFTAVAFGVIGPRGAHGERPAVPAGSKMFSPAARQAVAKGLAWLATHQHADGSFGSGARYRRNVAVASLCGMAFLSAGHTPGRGPYGRHVERTVAFILKACQPNGFILVHGSESHGPMYGHGFATLFLAEAYGMSRREDLRSKLKKAVELIINTQNNEGGWRYAPEPRDADVSVTVCQMMALRAARNAGLYVPADTIDRSVAYVRGCQDADGGFRYQLKGKQESQFPRSAAAIVGLYSAGIYKGTDIERGLDYVMRFLPRPPRRPFQPHYYYAHYYAVQAMWQAGGQYWSRWYPAIRDELLARQLPDGRWTDQTVCDEYGTAMACLVLLMPESYLPIFRK
ncbi:MAG: terpene cyclase/mutase family protein [Planctomycetes bacterium]|nr:terpene cyclase/mutase family protein [Planctomycetota bacterium]